MSRPAAGKGHDRGRLMLMLEVEGPGIEIAESVHVRLVRAGGVRGAKRGTQVKVLIEADRTLRVVRENAIVKTERLKTGRGV